MNALVRVADGRVVADSRDVAAEFGKQHAHVLRSIDSMLEDQPTFASNFGCEAYPVNAGSGGTRMARRFDMDRKGFMLLVMGFSGAKALAVKSRWIDAFDAMERALHPRFDPINDDDDDVIEDPMFAGPEEVERLKVKLALVREARHVYGRNTARTIWEKLGLPDGRTVPQFASALPYAPDVFDPDLARWLVERVERAEGARVEASIVYQDYVAWCHARDIKPLGQTPFGRQLSRHGILPHKSGRVWRQGVRLKD